jgi:redox-sensitive bicupin YhaK (pirin superfamily)
MTRYVSPDGKYSIDIIAGEYKGLKGPAQTFSPVSLMNVNIIEGSEALFSFPATYNSGFLVVEGEVITNEEKVVLQNHFVRFGNSGEDFLIKALKNSKILVMAGEPLNEPVFPHGPFVMNSAKEINQAWEDYHNGKFGYLED